MLESPGAGRPGPRPGAHDAATGARTVLVDSGTAHAGSRRRPAAPDRRLFAARPTAPSCWSSPTRNESGGRTPGATTGCSTRDAGTLQQAGRPLAAKPSTLMFAKFSPDGGRVGYVRENNLYVEDLATRRDHRAHIGRLAHHHQRHLRLGLRRGVLPAGRIPLEPRRAADRLLAARRLAECATSPLINNTDSLYSFLIPIQYPKAGTTNSAVRIGVVNAAWWDHPLAGHPGRPRNTYLARLEWAANSDQVVLQRLNRLQNTIESCWVTRRRGEAPDDSDRTDSAWVDVVNDWRWLDGGKSFTWVSERDGWRHVYTVSRDGTKRRLVTRGDFDVAEWRRSTRRAGGSTTSPRRTIRRSAISTGLGSTAAARPSDSPPPINRERTTTPSPGAAAGRCTTTPRSACPRSPSWCGCPVTTAIRTLVENATLKDDGGSISPRAGRLRPGGRGQRRDARRRRHASGQLRLRPGNTRCCSTSTVSRRARPSPTPGVDRLRLWHLDADPARLHRR